MQALSAPRWPLRPPFFIFSPYSYTYTSVYFSLFEEPERPGEGVGCWEGGGGLLHECMAYGPPRNPWKQRPSGTRAMGYLQLHWQLPERVWSAAVV